MNKPFRLKNLIVSMFGTWVFVWSLGVLTLICVLGLLMASGWFVVMAGLSGVVMAGVPAFDYLAVSAVIRNFAIGRTLGRYGDLVMSHKAIFELLKNLRVQFFEQFAKLDPTARTTIGSATAQHRLVKDIDVLNEFPLKVVSPQVTVIVASLLIGLIVTRYFSAVVLIGFLVIIGLSWLIIGLSRPLAYLENKQKETRAIMLIDTLPSLTQLVLWDRWQQKSEEFLVIDKELTNTYHKAHRQRRWGMLLVSWQVVAVVVLVLLVGVGRIEHIDVAVLLAVVFLVFGFFEIANMLVQDPLALGRSQTARDNLNALLGEPIAQKVTLGEGEISWHLQGLSAKQPKAVFGVANVNCTIKTGVPLVIQGVSGGGKSTLLDTLANEIVAVQGRSLVQVGEALLASDKIDWQGELGYLGQKVDIFDKTLKENLLLGKPSAFDEELLQALDLVGLGAWVKSEPMGLDTPLGEYGVGVSGGQARRIALARLLLTPKRVLLLDEPFAGLDKATRLALWKTLKDYQKEGILVVVSHHDDIIDDTTERLVIGEPQAF